MAVGKAVLAAVTVVMLASQLAVVVPLLAPLHLWAARRAEPVGAGLWALAAGLGAAAAAWALTYAIAGERQPVIWLVPASAGAAASAFVRRG